MSDVIFAAARAAPRRFIRQSFTAAEWTRLAGLYGCVGVLHLLGWGLYLHYAGRYPQLVGLGFVAYMFGLRHAFDADHIAAVDDTVRFMLQKGKQPLGVGFFFSLGHSTIVLALAIGIAFAANAVKVELPQLKSMGAIIGAGVSGTFLWIIGILNLLVLLDILQVWRSAKSGTHSHAHLEALLQKRGLLNRLFGGRLQKLMNHSWQMYPLGLLFGLGFDTASEVGLLAMTAGASAGDLPIPAVLCLPILFAAGMTMMDTTDGVLMSKAYNWAFLNPLRKIFYNITTTGLSVAVALLVGTIELLQVLTGMLDLHGPFFDAVAGLDFGILGYLIVAMFLLAWSLSVGVWKFGRIEQRYSIQAAHAHIHVHDSGVSHSHDHAHLRGKMLGCWAALVVTALCLAPTPSRADTVATLLGNFTINQYCGLRLSSGQLKLHYVVIFGQLPALRELHLADADGDGVTSQSERDAYVGKLAPGFAEGLVLDVNGIAVPLKATQWHSSLPTEQGGFSLRVDVDYAASIALASGAGPDRVSFTNQNFPGRIGWHEIAVESAPGIAIFDTNAFSTSLTNALTEALQSLPAAGPLDERTVRMSVANIAPAHAVALGPRSAYGAPGNVSAAKSVPRDDSAWIARSTKRLVDSISGSKLEPRIALLALLGALLLGAVHALSPGHGKTIVGAYLIGSRGTPRHAAFLGLTVTVTHTLGVFLLGFATLYASQFIVPERLFPILSLISAVLVLGMGAILLVQRTRAVRQTAMFYPVNGQLADGTMHSHGGVMHSHLPPGAAGEKITWRSLLTLGISGGLVPCPAAMVLLLAAVALNKTAYGMLLVVAFSVGLAVTLTAIGMAFLYARNHFRRPQAGSRWPQFLPVLSAGIITLLGLGLSYAALKSFGA
jgi:nickel/cobalt transporter (NiCoT) family protein